MHSQSGQQNLLRIRMIREGESACSQYSMNPAKAKYLRRLHTCTHVHTLAFRCRLPFRITQPAYCYYLLEIYRVVLPEFSVSEKWCFHSTLEVHREDLGEAFGNIGHC
jgi:hypothetical protein